MDETSNTQESIIFNEILRKYQLILPEDILIYALSILPPEEAPKIVHKDKMKLEWLYLDILKVYEQEKRSVGKSEKRNKMWANIYLSLIILLMLSAVVGRTFSEALHIPLWVIGTSFVLFFAFFFWKYFVYRMGVGFSRHDLVDTLEVLKLRARIQNEFS